MKKALGTGSWRVSEAGINFIKKTAAIAVSVGAAN